MGEFDDSLDVVAKGAIYIFLGMALSKVFYYLYRMIIARHLGPEIYGLFSLGFSVFIFSIIFSTAGVPQGMTRFVSKYYGKQKESLIRGTLWSGFELTIPLGIITGLIIYLLAPLIGERLLNEPEVVPVLKIFALMIPFRTFLSGIVESLKGFKRMSFVALIEYIFQPLILVIFVLIALSLNKGISGVMTAYLGSLVVSSFLGFYILNKKIFPILEEPIKRNHKELLTYSLPLLGVGLGATVISHSSNLIMGWLPQTSAAQIGIFNAAWPLAAMIDFLGTVFGMILFPVISSKLSNNENKEALDITSTTIRWDLSVTLPAILGLILFSRPVLHVLFGPEYTQAWFVLSIVGLAWFFNALSTPISKYLPAKDKTRWMLYNSTVVAIASILLNFLLVPVYGINGAGIATFGAILFSVLLILIEVIFILNIRPKLTGLGSVIISGLGSSIITLGFKQLFDFSNPLYNLLAGGSFFGASYIILFLLTGGLKDQDILISKKIYSEIRDYLKKSNLSYIFNPVKRLY